MPDTAPPPTTVRPELATEAVVLTLGDRVDVTRHVRARAGLALAGLLLALAALRFAPSPGLAAGLVVAAVAVSALLVRRVGRVWSAELLGRSLRLRAGRRAVVVPFGTVSAVLFGDGRASTPGASALTYHRDFAWPLPTNAGRSRFLVLRLARALPPAGTQIVIPFKSAADADAAARALERRRAF
jgi:hypothetical protein